jgi:carbon-monoxide dehydrogenase medium subunit/6-hydroxypseudooxynicotine dehydrogenase subunit alpha
VKLSTFAYTRARTVDDALALLSDRGADAKVLAGGQSLIPLMSLRLAAPAQLVDISELDELQYIRDEQGTLAIGGTTRHVALESAGFGGRWKAFDDAMPLVGHLPIRMRGTIGGSLAHADLTAELPLLAATFGANIVARSATGMREIPAESFFQRHLTTALEPDEMVVEARFPDPPAAAGSAFEEFAERAGDFALASACAAVAVDESGVCTFARVGVGAVAPRPIRSPSAEAALLGSVLDDETIMAASQAALLDCDPRGRLHVSAEFHRELIATMVRRALRRAAARLAGCPRGTDRPA